MILLNRYIKLLSFFIVLFVLMTEYKHAYAEKKSTLKKWSFVVLADPRGNGFSFRNALKEIRDMNVKQEPSFEYAELILIAGDMDPIKRRYHDFREVFKSNRNMKALYPVLGNHDRGKKGS